MTAPAAPLPGAGAETRRILALAWPVILTSLNWTILHVTDVIVVGLTGTGEAAALGASRALTFIGIVMVLGGLSGVLVFVSRADGAGDHAATGRTLHEGLVLGLFLGVLLGSVLFFFAQPLLIAAGVSREIAPEAARVVAVMALAYPFQLIIIAASFFLEGVSSPRRVMVVNVAMLPLNAVLAWALSGGHLGLPAWGAVGAAAATAIASALGSVAMLAAAWTLPGAAERGVRDLSCLLSGSTLKGAGRLLSFGVVPAFASGLELAGFSILIALSTQLGAPTAHAFQIVFSVHNVTFAVALGLGSAAGVRVGNAVGEGVPRAAATRAAIAVGLAAASTGVLAALLMLGRSGVVAAFPATAEVHEIALAMLLVWAPFILFDGINVVCVYALRSLGDQVVAGINSVIGFFIVTGGAGLLLARLGYAEFALVYASGIGMVVAAALNGGRLIWLRRTGRA